MAQAKHDTRPDALTAPRPRPGEAGYEPGGDVAELYSELTRRLAGPDGGHHAVVSASPGERMVRRLSVAGGYAALAAGYAVAALLMFGR